MQATVIEIAMEGLYLPAAVADVVRSSGLRASSPAQYLVSQRRRQKAAI
jgi:hypothetical protein